MKMEARTQASDTVDIPFDNSFVSVLRDDLGFHSASWDVSSGSNLFSANRYLRTSGKCSFSILGFGNPKKPKKRKEHQNFRT